MMVQATLFKDGGRVREGWANIYDRPAHFDDNLAGMLRGTREDAEFYTSVLRPVRYRIHVKPKACPVIKSQQEIWQ